MTGDKAKGGVRINRYEQEVNRADMDTAASLARHLNVPLAYLFSDNDQEAEMLLTFAKLAEGERAEVLAQLRLIANKER